jgi:hypothetical protein
MNHILILGIITFEGPNVNIHNVDGVGIFKDPLIAQSTGDNYTLETGNEWHILDTETILSFDNEDDLKYFNFAVKCCTE